MARLRTLPYDAPMKIIRDFVRLLAEKDAFHLSQINTQTVPPTVYGMSIRAADDPDTEVAVFAEV